MRKARLQMQEKRGRGLRHDSLLPFPPSIDGDEDGVEEHKEEDDTSHCSSSSRRLPPQNQVMFRTAGRRSQLAALRLSLFVFHRAPGEGSGFSHYSSTSFNLCPLIYFIRHRRRGRIQWRMKIAAPPFLLFLLQVGIQLPRREEDADGDKSWFHCLKSKEKHQERAYFHLWSTGSNITFKPHLLKRKKHPLWLRVSRRCRQLGRKVTSSWILLWLSDRSVVLPADGATFVMSVLHWSGFSKLYPLAPIESRTKTCNYTHLNPAGTAATR